MRTHPVVAACLLLCGCGVASVHPFYEAGDQVFDSTLIGTWGDTSSREQATFSRDGNHYDILYTDDHGKQAHFLGRQVHLGPSAALDVSPGQLPDSVSRLLPDEYWSLLLGSHTLFWLNHDTHRLAFASLDPDSLKAYLRRHPGAIAHLVSDSVLVLTAPTAELRAFVVAFSRRRHALNDSTIWWRREVGRAAPN